MNTVIHKQNFNLQSINGKPINGDIKYQPTHQAKPIVIFCHGYKGFKDWGAWHLMAEAFAKAGFFFVKFNFSHNGVTAKNLTEFTDLEAFGKDNYSIQLEDLGRVIDFFEQANPYSAEIDFKKLYLIGHSRGGGITLLRAAEDSRVKKLITWAGVSDFGNRFPKRDKLHQWKEDGVYFITNARTKQQMPHYIQFYDDFIAHQERLHIKTAVAKLEVPYLIIHGTHDETVPVQEAEILFDNGRTAKLKWIAKANHVFNTAHPWHKENLPLEAEILIKQSIAFLKSKSEV